MQRVSRRKNEKCESLSVCVSAPPEPINSQYVCVSPHENAVRSAPPEYKTHIYPMAQLNALKFDPDLDCSPPRQRSRTHKHEQRETLNEQARAARDAEQVAREAAQAAPRKRRGRERCSWLLSSTSAPPAKQNWKKKGYQRKWKCGLCASNEHDFSSCTKCRLCKNDGHWAHDCPEARKAD